MTGEVVQRTLMPWVTTHADGGAYDPGSRNMNTISRRLRKLEDRLGPPVETEFSRRLALSWLAQPGILPPDGNGLIVPAKAHVAPDAVIHLE